MRAIICIVGFLILFRPTVSYGICLNPDGDGHIEFCTDGVEEPYSYISYHGIAEEGEKVITLDLLNPTNDYCDDCIFIADYNMETKKFTIR